MFHQLESWLLSFSDALPLPVFAVLASFAEEIIAPIPSGPVLLVTGSIASLQGYSLPMLALLALFATSGKLLGSLVVYYIADKAEDVLSARLTKFLGITHEQIESFGKRLGNGWKDYVVLTVLRALPFVPSAVISLGAGVLKVPLRPFIFATIVGSIIRDAVFLYFGYIGFGAAETILAHFSRWEDLFLACLIAVGLIIFGYLFFRSMKRVQRKRNLPH